MNERIKELTKSAIAECFNGHSDRDGDVDRIYIPDVFAEKLTALIIAECAALNRKQGFNLSGVIADVKFSKDGFDEVCLNTVYGVEAYLFSNVFKKHFGVE